MTLLRDFDADPHQLAARLKDRRSSEDIARAWKRLLDLGLVADDDSGRPRAVEQIIRTAADLQDQAMASYHKDILRMAITAVAEQPSANREFGSYVLRVDDERIPEAKLRLREFLDEFAKEFDCPPGTGDKSIPSRKPGNDANTGAAVAALLDRTASVYDRCDLLNFLERFAETSADDNRIYDIIHAWDEDFTCRSREESENDPQHDVKALIISSDALLEIRIRDNWEVPFLSPENVLGGNYGQTRAEKRKALADAHTTREKERARNGLRPIDLVSKCRWSHEQVTRLPRLQEKLRASFERWSEMQASGDGIEQIEAKIILEHSWYRQLLPSASLGISQSTRGRSVGFTMSKLLKLINDATREERLQDEACTIFGVELKED